MRYIFLVILSVYCFACNSNNSDLPLSGSPINLDNVESPNIKIKLQGFQNDKVFLIGILGDQYYRADSTTADGNGLAIFKRDKPYFRGMYFAVLPNNMNVQVMIDADQRFTMTCDIRDVVTTMQVEGSIDNELLYTNLRFQNEQTPLFRDVENKMREYDDKSPEYRELKTQLEVLKDIREQHLNEIFTKYPNSLFTVFKRAGQNPEIPEIRKPDGTVDNVKRITLYKNQFWDDVDFSDERLLRTPVIVNKLKRYINELTFQHQDSIISSSSLLLDKVLAYSEYHKFIINWILIQYEPTKTTLMDPEAVFVHIVQNYLTQERTSWADSITIYGIQRRAYEMAGSVVGKQGPDVVSKDPSGATKSIYELKAPYVIVYMYNPDCEHCAEETPKLVNWYREWKNKGADVFAIAVETEDVKWKDYIRKNNMTFTNVFDPSNRSIYAKYYVDHTPELYVLNPERTIIGKNLKVSQIETIINRDKRKRG